jgi:hypothetical protein
VLCEVHSGIYKCSYNISYFNSSPPNFNRGEDYSSVNVRGAGNSRNYLRYSWNKVTPFFCPYMAFSDVSWHQMHHESRKFYEANDMEMSL